MRERPTCSAAHPDFRYSDNVAATDMNFVDELLATNSVFTTVTIVLVLAHAGALLGTAAFGKGIKPVLLVNLTVAAAVLVEKTPRLGIAIGYAGYHSLSLWAFELSTLLTSAAALLGRRIPAPVVWVPFSFNFLLSAALLVFALTFRMTRLF